jgi:maltooligosyltrehalose synthase
MVVLERGLDVMNDIVDFVPNHIVDSRHDLTDYVHNFRDLDVLDHFDVHRHDLNAIVNIHLGYFADYLDYMMMMKMFVLVLKTDILFVVAVVVPEVVERCFNYY